MKSLLLAALLLFALPLRAQTSVPVKNPSFELTGPMGQPVAGWGAWNNGPLTGWVQAGMSGAFQPALTVPDGKTIAWSNGGTLSQDLGIPLQPNTTYTLKVYVAHLTGGATYTLALNAGTANLCSSNGSTDSIPAATFALETLTCPTGATVPAGNLSIVLGSGGVQVEFDNVSLVIPGPPPPFVWPLPGFGTFTFPMQAPPDCSNGSCSLIACNATKNVCVTLLPGEQGSLVIAKPTGDVTVVSVGP